MVSTEVRARPDGEDLVLSVDETGTTLAHELGHYLGLFHLSEIPKDGNPPHAHDPIDDTEECRETTTFGGCPDAFVRNVMTSTAWATSGAAARRQLTEGQLRVLRRHPLCVKSPIETLPEPEEPTCDAECSAPNVCGSIGGAIGCHPACSPGDECDNPDHVCLTDDLGVFVCQ